jgi:hypothetical protein
MGGLALFAIVSGRAGIFLTGKQGKENDRTHKNTGQHDCDFRQEV